MYMSCTCSSASICSNEGLKRVHSPRLRVTAAQDLDLPAPDKQGSGYSPLTLCLPRLAHQLHVLATVWCVPVTWHMAFYCRHAVYVGIVHCREQAHRVRMTAVRDTGATDLASAPPTSEPTAAATQAQQPAPQPQPQVLQQPTPARIVHHSPQDWQTQAAAQAPQLQHARQGLAPLRPPPPPHAQSLPWFARWGPTHVVSVFLGFSVLMLAAAVLAFANMFRPLLKVRDASGRLVSRSIRLQGI